MRVAAFFDAMFAYASAELLKLMETEYEPGKSKLYKLFVGLSDYFFEIIGINACNKRNYGRAPFCR